LKRGDQVVATMRNTSELDEVVKSCEDSVLVLSLDVTDPDAVFKEVHEANSHFGRLDVILRNAGTAISGPSKSWCQSR